MTEFVEAREGRKKIGNRYDALTAENEALRKDAERYRWFRENSLQIVHASKHCFVHQLDKAIDEAMDLNALRKTMRQLEAEGKVRKTARVRND